VRGSRWLIFAPVAILALFSSVTHAEPIQGLDTTYYTIDEIPPVQSTTEYEECGSELENNINRSYDGEPYEECTGDLFMVHMTGFIEIPEHTTIEFMLASDDGGEISIGNTTFGVWQDQGCSATMSGELQLQAGVLPLELWMYENGGGACLMLAWKIDDEDWQIVPEEAFTTNGDVSTTTVAVTTTVESTTTSSVQTSTSLIPEPTMPEPSTTTTSTTTSTVVETTTTTEYVSPPVAQPPAVVEPEPIEEPTTEDTEPIQEPEEVVEETIPLEPPDTYPTVETLDTLPFVEELLDDTTPTEVLPDEVTEETIPIEETPVEELNDEELLTAIESIEEGMEVSEELAVAVAQSAEVVASLSSEEATAVFEAIEVDNLSTEEAQAIVEAVQDAPAEVREAFEEEINIFSPGFDNYVPLGSNIPVSTRRTLIAVAAGAAIAAAGTRRP
jgi:hypothetical protein